MFRPFTAGKGQVPFQHVLHLGYIRLQVFSRFIIAQHFQLEAHSGERRAQIMGHTGKHICTLANLADNAVTHVRFTRPVVVPDDDEGATLTVSAKIAEKLDEGLVRLEISATCADQSVLGRASAIVALA